MAKKPKLETDRETVPEHFPEVTTPLYSQAVGAAYLVESMMQLQQSVGELKAEVRHLKEASDKQGGKLDRISHVIYAAGAVLVVIAGAGGFLLSKIWDGLVILMNATK